MDCTSAHHHRRRPLDQKLPAVPEADDNLGHGASIPVQPYDLGLGEDPQSIGPVVALCPWQHLVEHRKLPPELTPNVAVTATEAVGNVRPDHLERIARAQPDRLD